MGNASIAPIRITCPRGHKLTYVAPMLDEEGGVVLAVRDLSQRHVELPGGGATVRAKSRGSRAPGQAGPLSGRRMQFQPIDHVFETGQPWRWTCRCKLPRQITEQNMMNRVAQALTRGEHEIQLS